MFFVVLYFLLSRFLSRLLAVRRVTNVAAEAAVAALRSARARSFPQHMKNP
jgi:hypothetical protein